ncbi:MAG TPA: HipA domain-containing protein [Solirubrobacterales bacterium]|nr:HipA domain-containing protein [Solirubrobacterales bacterium]
MSLDVYLHGKRIGALAPTGEDTYSFAYRPEVAAEASAATTLSMALPLRPEPYGPDASRAYIECLLPQGRQRVAIAEELGLSPTDGYGLIAALGRDCLGAVTFGSEGDDESPGEPGEPAWLDEGELEEILRWAPKRYFDEANPQRMRFALPGERHKLALVRDEEGDRWAWPQSGMPSTHIVKPETPERPGLVADEHACTLAYRELGIAVVPTAVEEIAGQTCLVSKRFDRWDDGTRVERIHQESFAQALGIAPDKEGQRLAAGTPSLSEARGLLHAIGEPDAIETLMRATFCDLLVGCAKLRGGGAALVRRPDNRPMLAPLYDIASTEIYGEQRPRPTVVGIDVPPAPLLIHLRHTIELCDAEFQPALIEAVRLMGPLVSALGSVAEDAWEEGWHRRQIDDAIQIATSRCLGFREESEYLRPPGAEPLS